MYTQQNRRRGGRRGTILTQLARLTAMTEYRHRLASRVTAVGPRGGARTEIISQQSRSPTPSWRALITSKRSPAWNQYRAAFNAEINARPQGKLALI